jgi:hypothetical protein
MTEGDAPDFVPTDPQSKAFREATAEDHWTDDISALIEEHGAKYHEPVADISEIRSPEDYESDEWDVDREPPKSLEDAKASLAARISNPEAPDVDEDINAYDELKD